MASLKNTTINDTGYLTIPSGTTAQRPAAPSAGMFRYNSDYKLNEFYNGTEWTTSTGENSIVQSGLVLWLDAGLQSSYPGSGTTWTDLSGNGNNGTLTNGPTYSSADGGSIGFDGANDYVSVQNSSSLNPSTNTLICWAKSNTSTWNQYAFLMSKRDVFVMHPNISSTTVDYYYRLNNTWVSQLITVPNINTWNMYACSWDGTSINAYLNGARINSGVKTGPLNTSDTGVMEIGRDDGDTSRILNGNISACFMYNRALTAAEIAQNYFALKNRFGVIVNYETLTYTTSANLTVTGNGTISVNIFKTSGSNSWDNQAYSTSGFTAPCTIEFDKQAGSGDNSASYAMIGWNEDPTANASYDTLDHASYPYATSNYQVYSNGSLVLNGGTWSTANKFYVVYTTDGLIRHYNGSTLLYTSSSYGVGKTVYVDSSFYSVNATFGGFSNIRVCRFAWNGTQYV